MRARRRLRRDLNPQGAGKWKAEYSQYFHGKRIYIVLDQDEPGLKHAADVAQSLAGVAATVLLVDLPDGRKDISDLAVAAGSRKAFREALNGLTARPGR